MSFFPVPAAAPAAAPIAAPLPPPASAPITAPPAAPPPMNPASRLPLPPSVLPAELVAVVYVLPPTVTVRSRSHSLAGVDSRPEACTALTVILTAEPLGITTLPPDITSCATEPLTACLDQRRQHQRQCKKDRSKSNSESHLRHLKKKFRTVRKV